MFLLIKSIYICIYNISINKETPYTCCDLEYLNFEIGTAP